MELEKTPIEGVLLVKPDVYGDARGFFMETFHENRYRESGIERRFVQDNLSFSVKNTVRGLHFQVTRPQAKLVQVYQGEIFDVAVDIRPGSPTFGKWTGIRLSGENHWQLFLPEGFAHGFCVVSETALVSYKCSRYYQPEDEGGILWSDPDIGIDWPTDEPVISKKDRGLKLLREIAPSSLYNPE